MKPYPSIKNIARRLGGLTFALAAAAAAQAAGSFGNLPLYFEAGSPAGFTAQGRDAQFSIGATGAQLVLHKDGLTRTVQLQFTGANSQAQVRGDGVLSGTINHLTGSQPAQWRTGIPTFARVQVAEVYPGISLLYYGNQQRLEYDFTVAPGASPEAITLHFTGADRIALNAQGGLVLHLGQDEILQPAPFIYQTVEGVRREISGGYKLLGAHEVAFTVGRYNPSLPLVIDPVLAYSTYFGGTLVEAAWSVAVDAADGSVFLAGQTLSKKAISNTKYANDDFNTSSPFSTPGAVQEDFGGGKITGDGFVARFDQTGTNLIYLTYLGGSADDFVSSVTVDTNGNAFMTGFTDSPDFPTANALYPQISGVINQKTKAYPGDAFIAQLDASGSNLVYSTYLGGAGLDVANSIALDASGNAYVAGTTTSSNFPTLNPVVFRLAGSTNPVLNQLAGTNNAFVTELSAGGSNLIFSTYLGGKNYDVAEGVAVDSGGNIYVTGFTLSTNFPTTNALSAALNQNVKDKNKSVPYDGFVSQLEPGGSHLVYSTYLGGTNNDVAYKIACDTDGNAYVTGFSGSPDFPNTTTNVLGLYSMVSSNKNNSGDVDAFLTKLDPAGAVIYSAFFGGKKGDISYGVAVDPLGNAFVTGTTFSNDFPTNNTADALRTKLSGSSDLFVTGFNTNASALIYSGYFGGKSSDSGYGIAVDSASSVYLTGQSSSKDFTLTNDFQPFRNGQRDAILTKITLP